RVTEHEPPVGPEAVAEVREMFSESRGPFDKPEIVAEVVADAEQRVLRVQEVVVPRNRSLPRRLAAADARRHRLCEEPVEAERAHEPEVRVDADDLIAIARRVAR